MRKRDLELIAALAEGTLEDESEARALLESSPAHRAEYEAQKAAIDALSSVPAAVLTGQEKAALRRDIWAELRNPPDSVPSRTPWQYRLVFSGAAVVVVVVGLAALLSQTGDDQGTTASEEVSSALTADGADQADAPQAAPEAAIETTEAATDALGGGDEFAAYFSQNARAVRDGDLTSVTPADEDAGDSDEEKTSCLEKAGLEGYEVIGELPVDALETAGLRASFPYLVAVPAGQPIDESTPIVFVEVVTCLEVFTDR